jgi:glycosyltransferase involved in cell wall biosynthesis
MGYKTQFLPNGVDIDKFTPVSVDRKQSLRRKYRLRHDAFIIVHVASIKRARNLDIFKEISRRNANFQVVIVGRVGEKKDEKLASELRGSNCLVWTEYFYNIEEIHALADCYVFPTIDSTACIETPLSVLEAMACNIPIITTRFGVLPNMFSEGKGLFFTDSDDQIIELVDAIHHKKPIDVSTRDKVIPYSWQNISIEISNIYKTLKGEHKL